jgi:hypothetical protein
VKENAMDLEAIKQRNVTVAGAMARAAVTGDTVEIHDILKALVFDDVPALVAEIERLRAGAAHDPAEV